MPKTTPDMIRLCAHACRHRLRTDWVDVMRCQAELTAAQRGELLAAMDA